MKRAIRLIADAVNLLAVVGLLAILFPFWLLDKASRALKWARS
jgi:hypothetical protein